ncbi:glycosyltransferase family 2 protein [Winogradskyella sp.]|jgi:cellulose synthase/poly-beta-1,6-N-acetylglucosamine synthase-like glycosyltransferase|uniref:glycosyltransferase n=1 Tax=Winogradskyella sp. TaxID=1883156 RepID=UPI0025F58FD2|nr:glycosyltransferase family 2 protein [Winogradskyella sp.]MCT4630354.1 glycosyltransferase family 2 protein [Winogradskyella sp.]
MEALNIILLIIEYALFIFFGFASLYVFIFALAGRFYKDPSFKNSGELKKIAVLIPGYKEDEVIVNVAKSALQQDYPSDRYDVVVIADSFQESTLQELKALPIKLIEVSFEKSTKSKALNKAMAQLGDAYDVALILDADNIMESDFVSKIDQAFANGCTVVQGHRVAKNLNTSFAILDAISEEVNNHIFRKGHRKLGLSASLIGSAMAFDYSFFKSVMANVNAIGGFDKELEFKLIKDKIILEYLNDAYVYDEKIQRSKDFQNQRRRWLSAQFVYLRQYFVPGLKGFFLQGNVDFIDKVYQMITPPRILLLGVVSIVTLVYTLIPFLFPDIATNINPVYWYVTFGLTVLAFFLAIPRKFYNTNTLKAAITLPKAFFLMFLMLFKLKGANKKFIHTKHGTLNN